MNELSMHSSFAAAEPRYEEDLLGFALQLRNASTRNAIDWHCNAFAEIE